MGKEKELFFLEEKLEKYDDIITMVRSNGHEKTFTSDFPFDDIEDKEFHKVRKYLVENIKLMDYYLKKRVDELEEKIKGYIEEK
tara:strand:- start:4 stop:255 length:252 start_codon:yes stop_codon:yes gene_type:complete